MTFIRTVRWRAACPDFGASLILARSRRLTTLLAIFSLATLITCAIAAATLAGKRLTARGARAVLRA
jgi:hypothetical protein